MKSLKFTVLVLAAMFMVTGSLMAQEKKKVEKKKIVIITETIDKDGNVVKEKIIKEGDDVKDFEWHDQKGNKKVVIVKEGKDGKTIQVTVDGETENIDMNEFEHEIEKSIHVNVDVDGDGEKKEMIIKIKGEDGEVETIKWQGDGEMSEELKKELKEKGVHLEMIHEGHEGEHNVFIRSDNSNKPFLGVVGSKTIEVKSEDGVEEIIESSDDKGALIGDVVEGSAAEAAGLKKGDVIQAINGKAVANFSDLADVLGAFKVGDKIDIKYARDDKAMETSATLKKHEGLDEEHMMEWNDEDGEHFFINDKDGKTIFIEVEDKDGVKEKKVIIKEKKKTKKKSSNKE
jgi:hypothetical protein